MLPFFWGLFLWAVFLLFQAQGIYGGDSGDLVTAAALGGVPHPPGYPLFTILGNLLSRLPLSTVAWRVGLLSSFPHAAASALVFVLVWRLTKHIIPALFSSFLLAGNYLFFLYSVTPEVFALFDFFLVALIYLVYTKQFGWASFILGLALSHHHVILFFIPSLFYWGFRFKKFIILGLLPYLYIPLAARGNAIINWDRAVDIQNFFRLVSRADYGTFVSSGFYGSELSVRLIQVKMYLRFLLMDLTWVGIVLSVFGCMWLWRRNRSFTIGLLLAILFLGPFFYFYASFPLVNRFTVGTYERFLLPSYLFFSIFIGAGVAKMLEFPKPVFRAGLALVLFLYPLSIGAMTVWRFWGLRTDRTVENLAHDILENIPRDAILLMQRDTPLFSTQYARYALGLRPDIHLIHSSRLPSPDYPLVIERVFPDLIIPKSRGDAFVAEFIKANSETLPVASITRLPAPAGWVWVQQGLIFLLTKESDVPSIDSLIARNDAILNTFHKPTDGILGRYNHLMLSDVRDVYATARIELGKTLVRSQKLAEAKKQFEESISLEGDTQRAESFMYLGLTELFLGRCGEALSSFGQARKTSFTPQPNLTLYEAEASRACGDEKRARDLLAEFEREAQKQQTPLE